MGVDSNKAPSCLLALGDIQLVPFLCRASCCLRTLLFSPKETHLNKVPLPSNPTQLFFFRKPQRFYTPIPLYPSFPYLKQTTAMKTKIPLLTIYKQSAPTL